MLDKYLKIFGLDNNFSLDELEGKYKKLLKEFDTKNIEDDLKIIFLEEQVKIREAYQILLKFNHTREKVSSIKSRGKTLHVKAGAGGEKNKMLPIIMTICALLLLALGLSGVFTVPPKAHEKVVVEESVEEVVVEDESIDVDTIVYAVLEEIGIVEEVVKRKHNVKHKVKPACNTKYQDNLYWGRTSYNLEKWSTRLGKKAQYAELTKEASGIISTYKTCGCSKCKKALKDGNLKKVKNFIKEGQ